MGDLLKEQHRNRRADVQARNDQQAESAGNQGDAAVEQADFGNHLVMIHPFGRDVPFLQLPRTVHHPPQPR